MTEAMRLAKYVSKRTGRTTWVEPNERQLEDACVQLEGYHINVGVFGPCLVEERGDGMFVYHEELEEIEDIVEWLNRRMEMN